MPNHWRGEWSDVYASFYPMGVADGIAIHHTAGLPPMETFDPAGLRQIEHGEMSRGYNALAYHTMFMLNGDSAESRPYGAMGAATGGHNDHTIAFCLPGYFHEPYYNQPTPEVLRAMAEEIKALKYLGFLTQNPTVQAHTWWTAGTQWATACCGSELIPHVAEVEAMSYDNWSPAQPAPPAQAEEGGNMWGVVLKLVDGRVEYLHGIGSIVQFSVIGVPDSWLGLPLNELNFIGYKFGGFPVKEVDLKTVNALRAATKALIGVEQANQLP